MNHERTYSLVGKGVNRLKNMSSRVRTGVVLGIGTLVLASCASNAPQDTWAPKGPNAKTIDSLQRIELPAGVDIEIKIQSN